MGNTAPTFRAPPKGARRAPRPATAGWNVSGSPYTITATGAADSDYTISYVDGALTVKPVALTITAVDKSKDYGAALPALTVSYTALVNGDTAAPLPPPPTTRPHSPPPPH